MDAQNRAPASFLDLVANFALIPIRVAVWTLRTVFDFFYTLLGGPPLPVSNPRSEISEFVRDFREKYDSNAIIPFLEMSYQEAVNEARRQVSYLLIYIHNPTHTRADEFSRDYLLSPEFVNFIFENNCLIWGASVRSSEGYKVCSALQDFNFPFLALLCVVDGQATCVLRMSGEFPLHSLVGELQTSCITSRPMLDRVHAERAQREMDSQLRREQEADYERSLAADRARVQERKRLESEKIESEKREDDLRKQEQQDLEDWQNRREEILASLPSEPIANGENVVRVAVRFPDGAKMERSFDVDDSLELLFNVVFSSRNCPKNFSLLSSYPRKLIQCAPEWYKRYSSSDIFINGTIPKFRDAGFEGSLAILVQDNDA